MRARLRAEREALDPAERRSRSEAAVARFFERVPLTQARCIATFAALDDEADPRLIAAAAERAGITVLYPRVSAGEIVFVAAEATALVPGHFGVREPSGQPTPLDRADVVITPGLAFDRSGRRLGYGRGYYDRALGGLSGRVRPLVVGFAFALQIVDEVPISPADVALDALVTDEGWLSFAPRPG